MENRITIMFILLYICAINGVHTYRLHLSPEIVNAVENTSVTLTCSKENRSLVETRWTNTHFQNPEANLYYYGGKCITTQFLHNNDLFEGMCNDNGTLSVLLKRVDRTQHGAVWQCKEFLDDTSNKVTINVLVPVSSVKTLNLIEDGPSIPMKENISTVIQCKTSPSRPAPTIFWFLRDPFHQKPINITNEANQSNMTTSDGLTEVNSFLNYSFNRSVNGWYIYCVAANIPGRNVTSKENELNVAFPPDGPPTITGSKNGSSYILVENEQGELSCTVTGGNPLANITMSCFNGSASDISRNGSTTSILSWTAFRYQDNKTCNCVAEHPFGRYEVSVSIYILYPPATPEFTMDNISVNRAVKVLQNKSLILVCETNSNPESEYTWINKTLGPVLSVSNVNQQDTGEYICKVNNTMIGSDGVIHVGSNNASINVHLLYPAQVGHMENISVAEGLSVNITCPVVPGNSLVSSVEWTLDGTLVVANSRILYISNISRDQEGTYICSVISTMIPTRGPTVEQITKGQLHLSVNYKALVLRFYIGESTKRNIFTVNETENVTFSCNIESKPPPNATISQNDRIIHVSAGNTNLVYTRENIQCNEFGRYSCSSINEYNKGIPSVRTLTLYVNCSPRPSTLFELRENVTSPRYTSAILRFSALAFPEPGPSGFTWYYLNGSQRIMLTNSRNVAISSLSSQSTLTIINVTESDYGQYILSIENPFGVYEQKFSLKPYISTTDSKRSSSTVSFVAVGVGTAVATLIFVGSGLFIYRFMRRRRKHNVRNDYRRHTEEAESATTDEHEVTEYDQISLKTFEEISPTTNKRETGTDSENSNPYESLDEIQEPRNQYDQLPERYEHMEITRKKSDNIETRHSIDDYVYLSSGGY